MKRAPRTTAVARRAARAATRTAGTEASVPDAKLPSTPAKAPSNGGIVPTSMDIISEALSGGESPYLLESSTFDRMIAAQRNKAARTIQDLNADIEHLQAQIDERVRRRGDLEMIIARADAALGLVVTVEGNER